MPYSNISPLPLYLLREIWYSNLPPLCNTSQAICLKILRFLPFSISRFSHWSYFLATSLVQADIITHTDCQKELRHASLLPASLVPFRVYFEYISQTDAFKTSVKSHYSSVQSSPRAPVSFRETARVLTMATRDPNIQDPHDLSAFTVCHIPWFTWPSIPQLSQACLTPAKSIWPQDLCTIRCSV